MEMMSGLGAEHAVLSAAIRGRAERDMVEHASPGFLALRAQGGEGSWRLVDCRAGCSHLVPFCAFMWDFTVSHLPPLN